MQDLIRELSEETAKVRFYKVDVDAQQDISKFVGGVHIMPTIFVYKSGAIINTMAGANPKGLRVRYIPSQPLLPRPSNTGLSLTSPLSRPCRT